MAKNKYAFLLIIILSLALFLPSLSYYFFQDDWFVLNWVRTNSFFSYFSFRTDIIYWRPLTMPIFFKTGYTLFKFNVIPLHLFVFIFHFINTVLIFKILKSLKLKESQALFGSFLYATASFQFIALSWLSTVSYVIGPTFIFLTTLLFLRGKTFLAFLSFLIALASSELALTFIPIAVILKAKNDSLKKLIPFFLVSAVYLLLRFIIFPIPRTGVYQTEINLNIFKSLLWYILWFFNVPEKMSTLIFFSNLKSSLKTSMEFAIYLIIPFISIIVTVMFVYLAKLKLKVLVKCTLLFLSGLAVFLVLPKHSYPLYLVVASLGPIYLISLSIQSLRRLRVAAMLTFGLFWFASSWLTLSFTRNNHWLVNEQRISRVYATYIKNQVPSPKTSSAFFIYPGNNDFALRNKLTLVTGETNVKQALNSQDALQVLYMDSSLESFYLNYLEPRPQMKDKNVHIIDPN